MVSMLRTANGRQWSGSVPTGRRALARLLRIPLNPRLTEVDRDHLRSQWAGRAGRLKTVVVKRTPQCRPPSSLADAHRQRITRRRSQRRLCGRLSGRLLSHVTTRTQRPGRNDLDARMS